MTAVCSGGPSEPRPGVAGAVYLTTAAISGILSRFAISWAIRLAAFMLPITFDVDDFCAVDPPADPGFTGADAFALIAPAHPDKIPAAQRFRDLVLRFAWYEFCVCSSVTTPSAPAAPSAPTGLPTIPTGDLPEYACATWEGSATVELANCSYNLIGSNFFAGNESCALTYPLDHKPLPSGAQRWRMTTTASACGVGKTFGSEIIFYDAEGDLAGFTFGDNACGGTAINEGSVPFGAVTFIVVTTGTRDAGAGMSNTTEFFCNAAGGGVQPACCPPDPIATGMLSQILSAVLQVQTDVGLVTQRVDLLQRQVSPFAFIEGTTHTGLTGDGTVSILAPIVGVRVDLVDAIEGTVGVSAGEPETLFNLGWIRWGDDAGWRDRTFIDTTSVVSTPYAAGAMTTIGYSLPAGVEIDIVELLREP